MPREHWRPARLAAAGGIAAIAALPTLGEPARPPRCTLHSDGTHAVMHVIDAETVLLDDGREVRLIGALAPRAPRPDAEPWPPEAEAAQALRRLVQGGSVEVTFAAQRSDRYGRLLAHLFVESGGGRTWVQGELLKTGHARAYGLPGSYDCMPELIAHETVAREARAGLWANAAYRARSAARPGALMRHRNTYQIVAGEIVAVAPTRARTYLNFGADWRRDFTAGIDARVLRARPDWARTLAGLKGRRVEVRGWIEYRNGPYINVEDPSQIAVIEERSPAPRPGGPTMSRGDGTQAPAGPNEKRPALSAPGALDL